METREELLEGLRYVKGLITKILAVQNEQVRIVDAYRKEETGISTEGFGNRTKYAAVIIGVAATLFYLVTGILSGQPFSFVWFLVPFALAVRAWMKNKRGKKFWAVITVIFGILPLIDLMGRLSFWVIFLPVLLAAFFGIRYAVGKKNEQVEQHNIAINEHNAQLQAQYDETAAQLASLKKELFGNTSSWYPASYYSLNAAEFFVNVVENYRADTIKEMVNLYEATKEQKEAARRQEEINQSLKQQALNQAEISKQLKYANVLNMASLFMQAGTQSAINANTDAVRSAGAAAAGNIRNGFDSIGAEIRNIGKKL